MSKIERLVDQYNLLAAQAEFIQEKLIKTIKQEITRVYVIYKQENLASENSSPFLCFTSRKYAVEFNQRLSKNDPDTRYFIQNISVHDVDENLLVKIIC